MPYLVAAGRIFDALDEGGDEGYAFAWRRQWRLRILLLPCSAADADGNAAGLVDTLQSIEEATGTCGIESGPAAPAAVNGQLSKSRRGAR